MNQGTKSMNNKNISNWKKRNQNIKIAIGYNSLNNAIPNEMRSFIILFLFRVIYKSFAHLILLLINPLRLLE